MSVQINYYVHGTTTDNERGLATGWEPGELSVFGVQQSKDLRALVVDHVFDAVIASDLKRALDSAELTFGDRYVIEPDKRLREVNYGDDTGKREATFKRQLTDHIDTPFPGGESYRDVERRLRNLLHDLWLKHQNQHVALVSHQAPQLALEVLLHDKSWPEAIAADWRHTKAWQPGWEYELTHDPSL